MVTVRVVVCLVSALSGMPAFADKTSMHCVVESPREGEATISLDIELDLENRSLDLGGGDIPIAHETDELLFSWKAAPAAFDEIATVTLHKWDGRIWLNSFDPDIGFEIFSGHCFRPIVDE
jgi:hypothetical protein